LRSRYRGRPRRLAAIDADGFVIAPCFITPHSTTRPAHVGPVRSAPRWHGVTRGNGQLRSPLTPFGSAGRETLMRMLPYVLGHTAEALTRASSVAGNFRMHYHLDGVERLGPCTNGGFFNRATRHPPVRHGNERWERVAPAREIARMGRARDRARAVAVGLSSTTQQESRGHKCAGARRVRSGLPRRQLTEPGAPLPPRGAAILELTSGVTRPDRVAEFDLLRGAGPAANRPVRCLAVATTRAHPVARRTSNARSSPVSSRSRTGTASRIYPH